MPGPFVRAYQILLCKVGPGYELAEHKLSPGIAPPAGGQYFFNNSFCSDGRIQPSPITTHHLAGVRPWTEKRDS